MPRRQVIAWWLKGGLHPVGLFRVGDRISCRFLPRYRSYSILAYTSLDQHGDAHRARVLAFWKTRRDGITQYDSAEYVFTTSNRAILLAIPMPSSSAACDKLPRSTS